MFLLGTGLAKYLGVSINLTEFLLGLIWVYFLQIGFFFLSDYFGTPFDQGLSTYPSPATPDKETIPGEKSDILLYSSLASLTAAAALTIFLAIDGGLNFSLISVMLIYFVLFFLLVIPGINLDLSGLGEILTSIILVILPPALAFLLQVESLHRLLPLIVFPVFPLHLAMIIVLRLSRYRSDLVQKRQTLLVRIGWIQGIFIHNLLIISGFLLFGITLLFGIPIQFVGPIFLVMPLAGYLIWYLSQLEDGAPVRWLLIKSLSLISFFTPVYLLTYTAWIR
jgi:1,4-dihydroxy-2-naphthoate octaprenyltransferase